MDEPGSRRVARWLRQGVHITSRLTEVEIVSALARRSRMGELPAGERNRLLEVLEADLESLRVVEIVPPVVALARRLLLSHPLRAADAVHLASALLVAEETRQPVSFACFDDRLALVAGAEGLAPLV